MKRRVLLFPRYSHGMCLVKSVFHSIGAVKCAVLCGRDGMSMRMRNQRKKLRDGQRCAIVTSRGMPLWQAAADKVSFRDGLDIRFVLYGL